MDAEITMDEVDDERRSDQRQGRWWAERDDLRLKFTAHKTKWAQKSLALASLLSAWFCGVWHALSHSGRMLTSQLPHLSE